MLKLFFDYSYSFYSCKFFKPIQAGIGEIGIKAEPLAIGDRYFYISDKDPFAADSHFTFGGDKPLRGGPLYQYILKGISLYP